MKNLIKKNLLLSILSCVFVVIFAVVIVSGVGINPITLLYLPVIMAVEYTMCLGGAMLTSALTVYFRDLEYILSIYIASNVFEIEYYSRGIGAVIYIAFGVAVPVIIYVIGKFRTVIE